MVDKKQIYIKASNKQSYTFALSSMLGGFSSVGAIRCTFNILATASLLLTLPLIASAITCRIAMRESSRARVIFSEWIANDAGSKKHATCKRVLVCSGSCPETILLGFAASFLPVASAAVRVVWGLINACLCCVSYTCTCLHNTRA